MLPPTNLAESTMQPRCLTLPCAVAALALCACASSAPQRPTAADRAAANAEAEASQENIPPQLAAPDGRLLLRVSARGSQNYRCQPKDDNTGVEWLFTGPDAELFDERGATVGHHGAGPYWKLVDGSKVIGAVKAKVEVPGSIPLLLVDVKSAEGLGQLTGARYIQRLDTEGGAPPPTVCDMAHAGATAQIPYRANYLFYGSR